MVGHPLWMAIRIKYPFNEIQVDDMLDNRREMQNRRAAEQNPVRDIRGEMITIVPGLSKS